jgi:chromatin remodeling complex protein RSC6
MWHSCDEKLITIFDSDKQFGLVDLIEWFWRIMQNYAERGDASNVFCPQTLPFFPVPFRAYRYFTRNQCVSQYNT